MVLSLAVSAALLVEACYAWVRARASHRQSVAGRRHCEGSARAVGESCRLKWMEWHR